MNLQTWNRESFETDFPQCHQLSQVFARLESMTVQRGEVICEIIVNGRSLSEDEELTMGDCSLDEVQQIAIKTDVPGHLVQEALRSVRRYLPDLNADAAKLGSDLRLHGLNHVQAKLDQLMEGCIWVFETIKHLRGAANGMALELPNADRWLSAEQLMNQALRELVSSMQARDLVMVADLIEHDLTGALQAWEDLLQPDRGPTA